MSDRLAGHLPLVAILRGITPDEIEAHVEVLIGAGISLIEIPTNSPVWSVSVAGALKCAAGRALVGAGTVLSIQQVDELLAVGGQLMVTPNTDATVTTYAVARGLLCMTGFATPSEAFVAMQAGSTVLKLFPAAHYGPTYVKAIRAVLPASVNLLAVGGVTPANLAKYLDAGCTGAGLGSDLYAVGQSPTVTAARAAAFVAALHAATGNAAA